MKFPYKIWGFTLPELIITVVIVSILATAGFYTYSTYTVEARNAQRTAQIDNLSRGLSTYKTLKWFYPAPSDGVNITYSWATLWNQGVVWESVFNAIDNPSLSSVPTDIVTQSYFAYSVSWEGNEFQIAWVLESPTFLLHEKHMVNQVYAAWGVIGQAYVVWKFNWKVLPARAGSTLYIVVVPSMIASDVSDTNYLNILSGNKLVFDGESAIPASFSGTVFASETFSFTPPEVVIFTWSTADLYTESTRVGFIKNMQDAYTGTSLANDNVIAGILDININESNPSTQTKDLACSVIGSVLWQTGACNTLFAGTGSWTTGTTYEVPIDIDLSNLPNPTVNSSFVDSSGRIWFATNGGIWMYDGENWVTYTTADGLAHNIVKAITEDISGNMWFGTNNGLSEFTGDTWTTYTATNSGLAHSNIRALYAATNGDLRVWTNNGVSRLVGSTWTTYTKSNSWLLSSQVQFIGEDHSGYIWFWSASWGNKYVPGTNTWTSYRASDWLINNNVQTVFEDSSYDIWFWTSAWVSQYDGSYTNYTENNSDLINNNVKSFFEDSRGYLWIWTWGWLSQKVWSTWTNYTTPDGLAGNVVYDIYEESDTDIVVLTEWWATTIDF